MCENVRTREDRRFRRRSQITASSCLVLYIVCSQLALRTHGAAGFILAAFAGAFFFAELIAVGLLVLRLRDEFQRVLLTRSFLWATVITMGLVTIWGFVELHSRNNIPHLHVLMVPLTLICLTAAAKVLIFRKHRSPVE